MENTIATKKTMALYQNHRAFLTTVDKNDTVSFGFKWFHSKMKP